MTNIETDATTAESTTESSSHGNLIFSSATGDSELRSELVSLVGTAHLGGCSGRAQIERRSRARCGRGYETNGTASRLLLSLTALNLLSKLGLSDELLLILLSLNRLSITRVRTINNRTGQKRSDL